MYAFGSIAAQLDDPDDEFLRLCLRVAERIAGAYIYLWPKQRAAVHDVLISLMTALESKTRALQHLLQHFVDAALLCTLAPPNPEVTTGMFDPLVKSHLFGTS